MKYFSNEIFYIINILTTKNKYYPFCLKVKYIKTIIYINDFVILLLITCLKIYQGYRVKNDSVDVQAIWFATGKKSISLHQSYNENFGKDITLISNSIFSNDSFLILNNSLEISNVRSKYFSLRNDIIELLKENNLFKLSLVLKYVYKSFYLALVWHIFENKTLNKIIITEKESSWGLLLDHIYSKSHCEVVVIPHGVEYNFLFPEGYPGDKFYTTTYRASIELNEVYKTKKFIFDKRIATQVMGLKITEDVNPLCLVYFPEGRNISIDQNILKELVLNGVKPYLCIHPLDKKINYSKYNLQVIEYDKAIKNSIVISRNSTVLLEALAHYSVPISLICNKEDLIIKKSIPSLNIKEILTVNSVQNLINLINKIDPDNVSSRIGLIDLIE